MNLQNPLLSLLQAATTLWLVLIAPTAQAAENPATAPKALTPHTITTRDGDLYYETEGKGPPLVLVPGGPGGSRVGFQPWFSRMADTHTVVYFDAIGRGRSARLADPARYTVQRDVDDIEALRTALGVERITLFGQSYGGIPALLYALKYPEHVDKLVLSSAMTSAASFQANIDATKVNLRTYYPDSWERVQALRLQGVKSGDERSSKEFGRLTEMLYWHNADFAKQVKKMEPNERLNATVYAAMLGDDPDEVVGGTLKGYDPGPLLPRLRAPTLITNGRFDRVTTPEIARQTLLRLPAGRAQLVTFESSGHKPWIEEADRYFARLREFLDGADLPAMEKK